MTDDAPKPPKPGHDARALDLELDDALRDLGALDALGPSIPPAVPSLPVAPAPRTATPTVDTTQVDDAALDALVAEAPPLHADRSPDEAAPAPGPSTSTRPSGEPLRGVWSTPASPFAPAASGRPPVLDEGDFQPTRAAAVPQDLLRELLAKQSGSRPPVPFAAAPSAPAPAPDGAAPAPRPPVPSIVHTLPPPEVTVALAATPAASANPPRAASAAPLSAATAPPPIAELHALASPAAPPAPAPPHIRLTSEVPPAERPFAAADVDALIEDLDASGLADDVEELAASLPPRRASLRAESTPIDTPGFDTTEGAGARREAVGFGGATLALGALAKVAPIAFPSAADPVVEDVDPTLAQSLPPETAMSMPPELVADDAVMSLPPDSLPAPAAAAPAVSLPPELVGDDAVLSLPPDSVPARADAGSPATPERIFPAAPPVPTELRAPTPAPSAPADVELERSPPTLEDDSPEVVVTPASDESLVDLDDSMEQELGFLAGSKPPASLPPSDAPRSESDASLPPSSPPIAGFVRFSFPPARASVPPSDPPAVATPSDRPNDPVDRGAEVALRTVRSRKRRHEHLPLIGTDAAARRARLELLEALSSNADGPVRANLLASIAEVHESLGDLDAARRAWRLAHEADPTHIVALRTLRIDAVARRDFTEAAALLEAEAALPLSSRERAVTLAALAEIAWHALSDAVVAERAAKHASELVPDQVAAGVLHAEVAFAREHDADGLAALERVARSWNDPLARAALLSRVARVQEREGRHAGALTSYRAAFEAEPTSISAALGVARNARATGDTAGAISALVRAADIAGESAAGEALRRSAARLLSVVLGKSRDAVALLERATTRTALEVRAEAALSLDDRSLARTALEAWIASAVGTERAIALVRLAELLADAGEIAQAEAALREAADADGTLATIRVARESIARRSGDAASIAATLEELGAGVEGSHAAAAAKLARSSGSEAKEAELCARALEAHECVEAVSLVRDDARLAHAQAPLTDIGQDTGSADASLDRASLALARRDEAAARDAFHALLSGHPTHPIALRLLARLDAGRPDAAQYWLDEATTARPDHAAFACTMAARILERAGQPSDAESALRRALTDIPAFAPACFVLERVARATQDHSALEALAAAQAEHAPHPSLAATHYARAALLATSAPERALTWLERVRELAPTESIVGDLVLRFGASLSPSDRARTIEAIARAVGPSSTLTMRLARAHHDAGEPARAAALYRDLLLTSPDAYAAYALERAELDAGEIGRVGERRFGALHAATSEEARVHALERLADLDQHERGDAAAAVLSLQSILEIAPGHLPSLRSLERYFMIQRRDEDLADIEEALAEHLTDGRDIAAHARFAIRLRSRSERASAVQADAIALRAARKGYVDLWLARRVEGAALATKDVAALAEAYAHTAFFLTRPAERATAAVRSAMLSAHSGQVANGLRTLEPAAEGATDHLVAWEALAAMKQQAGDAAGAAEAFEISARAAKIPERAVAMWIRAADAWDTAGVEARAVTALEEVAAFRVSYGTVFDRLRRAYEARDDHDALAKLLERRLAEGGDAELIRTLQVELAKLRETDGDDEAAKGALRAALASGPDDVEALRKLADLCDRTADWKGAAEALIRLARIRRERMELRDIFFRLGEIYDLRAPDPRRAEAAYRRALKLVPSDLASMQRLADLYLREEDLPQAREMLLSLAETDPDAEKHKQHLLRLADVTERLGDARQAESILEQARRLAPLDLGVVRALAELYGRQAAHSALAMHLQRAVADLRREIESNPGNEAAWLGLIDVLSWRGKRDAARVVASSARAAGIVRAELDRFVDATGEIVGAQGGAADAELDDVLSPPALTPATRAVFRLAGDTLERTFPFDPRVAGAERLGSKDHPYRRFVDEVSRWFGVGDVELYITSKAPRVCVPFQSSPIAIIVGQDLLALTDERERYFLFARAIKLAKANLALAVRTEPRELALILAGLVRCFDAMYAPSGIDASALDEVTKRISKALSRRQRDELLASVLEMVGTPGFDAARLPVGASGLGDRVAMLAVGSVPVAISSLLKLAGGPGQMPPAAQRVDVLRKIPEASALLAFALSDAHFDARHRVGADRK